ncbi:MAG: alpha/beta hydrolase [Rhodothermales bacterium]|nr:alpha/beta hydrolase [Rhodothermales bacterium]
MVLVHGYAEHSGRYDRIAGILENHEYSITRFDLRGYGRSPGTPALVSTLDEYVDDLVLVVEDQTDSSIPLILFGHSMGGLIVLRSLLTRQLQPSAMILSSPALAFFEPRLLQKLSGVIGRLLPAIQTIPLNRDLVSRNADVVKAARADPLCYQGRIKAGTGAAIVRAAGQVNAALDEVHVPFLVLHGEQDRLVDFKGSKRLYNEASSIDKTLNLYPESVHETLNDYGHEQVETDIVHWLDERF